MPKKKEPVDKFRRPEAQRVGFSEIGSSGLNTAGGTVREEFLPELQGRLGIKNYKEMRDNDPIIGAILFAVEMLIRQANWHLDPFKDAEAKEPTPQDKEIAEFVDSCREDMSSTWQDVLTEVLTMLPFGWAYLEIVYKKRDGFNAKPGQASRFSDGRIGWRKMPLRPQDTFEKWEFDDSGGIKGLWQRRSSKPSVFIPVEKALLFRTLTAKNNPEGRSILRNSYRPWYFKKRIEEIEGVGIERDLAGLPTLQPPENVDIWDANDPTMAALRTEAETVIRNIRRDEQEGVLLPFGWELTLLSTGGRRNFDTSQIIDRYNNNIAMSVLADFIVLGHNNRYGSFALAGSKTHMFGMAIGGWLEAIKAVFNRYAIPRLLAINGLDAERAPQLVYTDVEVPNLKELGDYIKSLHDAGFQMFPNILLEKKLLQFGSLPSEGVELGREAPKPEAKVSPDDADPDDKGDDKGDSDDDKEAVAKQARDEASQILGKILKTVEVIKDTPPPAPVPSNQSITVTVPERTVVVHTPEVKMEPVIHVAAPAVTVEAPAVTIQQPPKMDQVIERDDKGLTTRIRQVPPESKEE